MAGEAFASRFVTVAHSVLSKISVLLARGGGFSRDFFARQCYCSRG